jgi:hypothetical protein
MKVGDLVPGELFSVVLDVNPGGCVTVLLFVIVLGFGDGLNVGNSEAVTDSFATVDIEGCLSLST